MMAIVFFFYLVWIVVAVVVVAPLIVVFLPVLLIPALVLPIIATHYLPMLTARAVEGLEFCLGIRTSGGAYLRVGDVVEAVANPGVSEAYYRKPALARIKRVHSGWLYRLFRGDRYDVEVTDGDEEAVKQWENYAVKHLEEFKQSRNEVLDHATLTLNTTPSLTPTLTLPRQLSTGNENEEPSESVAPSQGYGLNGVKLVANLASEEKDPAKIIKRASASTTTSSSSSSSATKLQLEDEEKQQIGEATLDFKASVTVVLCVVVMALPLVQFYQRDQTWSEHAHDLILDTFGWEQLSLQFRLNLTWPKFNVPAISASFFLSLFVLFLTLVRVYATQLLLWCSGQPWFAMAESKPGKWEQRGLVAFASVRYVG